MGKLPVLLFEKRKLLQFLICRWHRNLNSGITTKSRSYCLLAGKNHIFYDDTMTLGKIKKLYYHIFGN